VVIKSTLQPGTTRALQNAFPHITVLHSPEFLSRSTVVHDAAHPPQNIIGIPEDTPEHRERAEAALAVLPTAPSVIVSSETSEFYKYVHNTSLFAKSVFMNVLYDTAQSLGVRWEDIQEMIKRDPMLAVRDEDIGHWHITPEHAGGRGIGGPCHIKDFETFSRLYTERVRDAKGGAVIEALKQMNIALLHASGKDRELLVGVYGDSL
jgi:UDP-glucose 6-dehydrogenase